MEGTQNSQHMQKNQYGANSVGAAFLDKGQDEEMRKDSVTDKENIITDATEKNSTELRVGNTTIDPNNKCKTMKSWLDVTLDNNSEDGDKEGMSSEQDVPGSDGDMLSCDMNGASTQSGNCDVNAEKHQTNTLNVEDESDAGIKELINGLDTVVDNHELVSEGFDPFTTRESLNVRNKTETIEMEDDSEIENPPIDTKCICNLALLNSPHASEVNNKCQTTKPHETHEPDIHAGSSDMKPPEHTQIVNETKYDGTNSDNTDTAPSTKSADLKSQKWTSSHNPVFEKALCESKDYLMCFAEILYKCTLCTQIPSIFSSKQSFIKHVSHQHLTKQKTFADCTNCSLKFQTVENMNEHCSVVHNESDALIFKSHDQNGSEVTRSHDQIGEDDSDSASSGHGSVGCHKIKKTKLEKDFIQPHTNCNHAGIEMKNGCLDLSLKDLVTSQQDRPDRGFKPKNEPYMYSPRSNERHSPHVDMSHLHKITDQIVKSNAPNKSPPNGVNVGFTPSYTHEFGKFTKLVREGGNIVYFCQVCNWKSPVKSTFQIHCGLNGHKVKVLSAEEQANGCSDKADSSLSQGSIEIDRSQTSCSFKIDQSLTSQYNINSSPNVCINKPNVCINKRSNCGTYSPTDSVSWMSRDTSAGPGKLNNLKGRAYQSAYRENERHIVPDMSLFESIHPTHRNGSIQRDTYAKSAYKNDLVNSRLHKQGESGPAMPSTRHKRRSPTSRRERGWSQSDSDSENETQKKRIYLGPRKHKTRILSTLLKPNTVPENCIDTSKSGYHFPTEKLFQERHGDISAHANSRPNGAAYKSATSSESQVNYGTQSSTPRPHTRGVFPSGMGSASTNPGNIDLSIVKKEATDSTTDSKCVYENDKEQDEGHAKYDHAATFNSNRKLDCHKQEPMDSLENFRTSPTSDTRSLFKLYKCHACLFEYSDIAEYEHHFETIHKSVQNTFSSVNVSKIPAKCSDTELGSIEMNENWRVNKLKEVLSDFVTVDDKANVSRDFLLQRISIVSGIPDMVGWSSACNRAVREVFPSSLAQRKGKYKKTYFFGVNMVETPAPQEELSHLDGDLPAQQPLRDMSIDMEKILSHMPAVVCWTGDMERGVYRDQMLVILADILDDPEVKTWGAQCNRTIRMMFPHVEMKRKGKFKTTVYFGVDFINSEYQAFVDSPKLSSAGFMKNSINNQDNSDRRHLLDMIHGKIIEAKKEAATDLTHNAIGCLKNSTPSPNTEDSPRERSPLDTREGTPMDIKGFDETSTDIDKNRSGSSVCSPIYPSWFQKEAKSEMRDYLARFGGVTMFDTGNLDENDGDDEHDTIDNDDVDEQTDNKTILNVPTIDTVGD